MYQVRIFISKREKENMVEAPHMEYGILLLKNWIFLFKASSCSKIEDANEIIRSLDDDAFDTDDFNGRNFTYTAGEKKSTVVEGVCATFFLLCSRHGCLFLSTW